MYGEGGGLGNIPKQGLGAGGRRWGEDGILKAQDPGARADLQATYTAGQAGSRGGGRAFPPL